MSPSCRRAVIKQKFALRAITKYIALALITSLCQYRAMINYKRLLLKGEYSILLVDLNVLKPADVNSAISITQRGDF